MDKGVYLQKSKIRDTLLLVSIIGRVLDRTVDCSVRLLNSWHIKPAPWRIPFTTLKRHTGACGCLTATASRAGQSERCVYNEVRQSVANIIPATNQKVQIFFPPAGSGDTATHAATSMSEIYNFTASRVEAVLTARSPTS